MKKTWIVLLSLFGIFVLFVSVESIWLKNRIDYTRFNVEASDNLTYDELSYFDISDYYEYVDSHPSSYPQVSPITIMSDDFTAFTGDVDVMDYEGKVDVILTGETSTVTWDVDVPQGGFYHILVHYFPYAGKSSSAERAITINGNQPFEGASNVTFHRLWGNESDVRQDLNGNDIRPSQVEKPDWTSEFIKDHIGYVNDPYQFYFDMGPNTITFNSLREPLMIEKIELVSISELPSYDDISSEYATNGYQSIDRNIELVEAEDMLFTTSPTLYPLNDRTSALTSPSHPQEVRLNTIGGNNWRVAGDKITWDFTVEESGLYEISMRIKQKLATGMNVYRNIYIDGDIPFQEMENYAFVQSNDWRIQTLGSGDQPYLFYFEAGTTHTLTMEVSLGSYGPLIGQVQSTINKLNKIYREILIYTGPEPDPYRDYQLTERIPNLLERLETEKDNLRVLRTEIQCLVSDISAEECSTLVDLLLNENHTDEEAKTYRDLNKKIRNNTSEKTGIIDTVVLQLEDFLEKPRDIHKNLTTYNSNISSLGTLVLLLSAQPLEVDYIAVHGEIAELPRANATTLESLWFSIRSFVSTFFTDYASLGQTDEFETDTTVEVWLSIGRDQANVLRKLIDESFTPETGIKIDLKLVNGAVLLPATLSNVGPDVAMGLGNSIPVNYAMRSAVYDISQFDDFEEVTERFKESAIVPFEYENGYYALPEQQIFLMLFYRTDIFEELSLDPPETWEDVITLIPDLQKHNLEFYLPVPITQGAVMNLPPNPIFSTLFYQNDGEFYIDGNTLSGFNEGMGPEVFELWTQFYTDYSFPVQANFVNRFRSGQMPIGITYYNTYNTLSVFAPEIRGKWDFLPVPGTLATDDSGNEYIRRETVSTGTSVMIMNDCENKEAAWKYLKWWTSTPVQVQFGREMEGILGAAARYPTANVSAMSQLPWTVEEYSKLEEQWDWVQGIPEVPGGYMTGRHLDNAFRLVYNDNANPKETIYDYVQIINDEISKKRREFGLE